jgi:hypothetical protein
LVSLLPFSLIMRRARSPQCAHSAPDCARGDISADAGGVGACVAGAANVAPAEAPRGDSNALVDADAVDDVVAAAVDDAGALSPAVRVGATLVTASGCVRGDAASCAALAVDSDDDKTRTSVALARSSARRFASISSDRRRASTSDCRFLSASSARRFASLAVFSRLMLLAVAPVGFAVALASAGCAVAGGAAMTRTLDTSGTFCNTSTTARLIACCAQHMRERDVTVLAWLFLMRAVTKMRDSGGSKYCNKTTVDARNGHVALTLIATKSVTIVAFSPYRDKRVGIGDNIDHSRYIDGLWSCLLTIESLWRARVSLKRDARERAYPMLAHLQFNTVAHEADT